jgi:membrane-associated protease RseP (regulator of RpoE activity)
VSGNETTIHPEGSAFSRFMAGGYGRLARVAFGATLIGTGLTVVGGTLGLAIAAFGLVPIATGVFNLCPVAPIWGGHFFGASYCPAKLPKR